MFKYDNLNAISTTFLSPIERVVEFIPRGVDGVAKVLSLSVSGKVLSSSTYDGYVDTNGRAEFKLIYIDLDDKVCAENYNADFSVRLDGDVTADDNVTVNINVVEWSAKGGDALTLSAVVKVDGTATKPLPLTVLVGAENSFSTTKTIITPTLVKTASHALPVSEETTVTEVDKVLSLDTKCAVKNLKVLDGQIDLSFDTIATVTFIEGGVMRTANFVIEENESIALDGVVPSDTAKATATVKSGRIVLHGVTGENVLRFEGEIELNFEVVRFCETEVTNDLFTLTHHTDIKRDTLSYTAFTKQDCFEEKVFGEIDLPKGENGSVVAIPASSSFVAKAIYDECLTVEGICYAEIIYSVDDEPCSIRAEIPFTVDVDGTFTPMVWAKSTVKDLSVKIKGGKADIAIDLLVETYCYTSDELSFISDVSLGEEKEVNRSGLSVYVADDGDTMWDVCKALTATPDQINAQNNLTYPLKDGDKIIYFRHLEK